MNRMQLLVTEEDLAQLSKRAKRVLDENWTGAYTIPAEGQYPHQWSWDSAFIAIGYAHYDQERAETELRHLMGGQWDNGMIPHILFSDEDRSDSYFPGPDFWETAQLETAPGEVKTSGICQPPVHATAVRYMLDSAPDQEQALNFARSIYPNLHAWHDFLARERDPNNEGLVYIRHPWESGQDNSPAWDGIMDAINPAGNRIPDYERKDNRLVDETERPSRKDYNRYIYLADFSRKRDYEEKRIRADGIPFLCQDVLFNALYCRANRDLAEIASRIGENPDPHTGRARKTARAVNDKLWDEEHGMYICYDLRAEQAIHAPTLSGFIPLYADIPDEQQSRAMFDYLNTNCFCRLEDTCFAAPSYDRSGAEYSSKKYWRGPVWINMNWLLSRGLERYGFHDYAERIRNTIIRLPMEFGFREYYDPDTGEGYGTDNFSWTASLLLDVLYRDKF